MSPEFPEFPTVAYTGYKSYEETGSLEDGLVAGTTTVVYSVAGYYATVALTQAALKVLQSPGPAVATDQKPRAIKFYKQGENGRVLDGAWYDGKYYPAKQAQGGESVFRLFGGGSQMKGESWTPIDPQYNSNFSEIMGIPAENSQGMLVAGRLNLGARYVELPASPAGGNGGGGIEFLLDNPRQNVNIELIKQWDFSQGQ